MNILLAIPEYEGFGIGGGATVFRNLIREFVSIGHTVIVIVGNYTNKLYNSSIKLYEKESVFFIEVPLFPTPKQTPFLRTVLPPVFGAWRQAKNILKTHKIDVAHVHGYGHILMDLVGLYLKKKKIPFVYTNHGNPKVPYTKGPIIRFIWEVYKKLLGDSLSKHAKIITVVGKYMIDENPQFKNKTVFLLNGIDLKYKRISKEERKKLRSQYTSDSNSIILLAVGRLVKYKNYSEIIRVMDSHHVCIFAGDDQGEMQNLLNLAKEMGVEKRCHFLGYQDQDRLNSLYQIADITVIPSIHEPFGLVGLESLLRKTPVVHSGVEGLVYLNASKNAHNYQQNENKLKEYIRKKISYTDENFVSNYSWRNIALQYCNYLKKTYEDR